jgi:hypothetical protein
VSGERKTAKIKKGEMKRERREQAYRKGKRVLYREKKCGVVAKKRRSMGRRKGVVAKGEGYECRLRYTVAGNGARRSVVGRKGSRKCGELSGREKGSVVRRQTGKGLRTSEEAKREGVGGERVVERK